MSILRNRPVSGLEKASEMQDARCYGWPQDAAGSAERSQGWKGKPQRDMKAKPAWVLPLRPREA